MARVNYRGKKRLKEASRKAKREEKLARKRGPKPVSPETEASSQSTPESGTQH